MAVQEAQANPKDDAHNIRDQVVDVSASVEVGLNWLNGAAKGIIRADENLQQPEAACAGQRKG